MKSLLALFISCFSFAVVQAQNPGARGVKAKPGASVDLEGNKYFIKPLNDTSFSLNPLLVPRNRKAGVYHLRQDNMPCIVPDTKGLAAMPNLYKGEIKIPFTGRPPRLPNADTPKSLPGTNK